MRFAGCCQPGIKSAIFLMARGNIVSSFQWCTVSCHFWTVKAEYSKGAHWWIFLLLIFMMMSKAGSQQTDVIACMPGKPVSVCYIGNCFYLLWSWWRHIIYGVVAKYKYMVERIYKLVILRGDVCNAYDSKQYTFQRNSWQYMVGSGWK